MILIFVCVLLLKHLENTENTEYLLITRSKWEQHDLKNLVHEYELCQNNFYVKVIWLCAKKYDFLLINAPDCRYHYRGS